MKKPKFNSKFWEICGDDELKPNMQCVYFTGGKLYATDGNVLLMQDKGLHNFSDDDIENLEGRMIHKDVLKSIHLLDIPYPELIQFLPDIIEVRAPSGTIHYSYFETNPLDFQSVIDNYNDIDAVPIEKISFNTNRIKKLSSAMVSTALIFNFKGQNKMIKITTDGYDDNEQIAYIMPMIISE
jgi:hypothetical protein